MQAIIAQNEEAATVTVTQAERDALFDRRMDGRGDGVWSKAERSARLGEPYSARGCWVFEGNRVIAHCRSESIATVIVNALSGAAS